VRVGATLLERMTSSFAVRSYVPRGPLAFGETSVDFPSCATRGLLLELILSTGQTVPPSWPSPPRQAHKWPDHDRLQRTPAAIIGAGIKRRKRSPGQQKPHTRLRFVTHVWVGVRRHGKVSPHSGWRLTGWLVGVFQGLGALPAPRRSVRSTLRERGMRYLPAPDDGPEVSPSSFE
jgi:hypothetical protein